MESNKTQATGDEIAATRTLAEARLKSYHAQIEVIQAKATLLEEDLKILRAGKLPVAYPRCW